MIELFHVLATEARPYLVVVHRILFIVLLLTSPIARRTARRACREVAEVYDAGRTALTRAVAEVSR